MLAIPFIFYLYRIVPKGTQVIDLYFFKMGNGGFYDLQTFFYVVWRKFLYIICFFIWFLSCKYWWRYVILAPITMLLFQISGALNQNIKYIDNYDFWYSLPIITPILLIILFIRKRLAYYSDMLDLKDTIDEEINSIKKNIATSNEIK